MEVKTFRSFEEESLAFNALSGLVMLPLHAGRLSFFNGFVSWLATASDQADTNSFVILPNPSLSLSFPFPRDELLAAFVAGDNGNVTEDCLLPFLERFNLPPEILNRPTLALSGGERVLVALCKAELYVRTSSRLVLCNPSLWLCEENWPVVDGVLDTYKKHNKNVVLLRLDGEPSIATSCKEYVPSKGSVIDSIPWEIHMSDLSVHFPATKFPRPRPGKTISFDSLQTLSLLSPTLLQGTNGIGKSTFARILAGLLRPHTGSARLVSGAFQGSARLLMQDALDQLFGASISDYLKGSLSQDKARMSKAMTLYEALQDHVSKELEGSQIVVGDRNEPNTVLQAKMALVATRLSSRPPLLILDEPGWCLSVLPARALIRAICSVASKQQTAILIISHLTSWWSDLAKSRLQLTCTDESCVSIHLVEGWKL